MMCRKSDSSKTDLAPKGHSERPWNNLLSALQPSVSPSVTKCEPVTRAQLQSILASCMKKNRAHQDEAVVNITEASVEQWLSQLSEATGEYIVIVSVNEITKTTCRTCRIKYSGIVSGSVDQYILGNMCLRSNISRKDNT